MGMDFAVTIYALTKRFPREEVYGLTGQLRRAAVAIPSNISEGHQQGINAYLHFVVLALGSLAEAETQIELSKRLNFVPENVFASIAEDAASLRRVLHGLRRSLAARKQKGANP